MVRWPKVVEILFISHWSIVANKVGNGAPMRKCINAKFFILTPIIILAAKQAWHFIKTEGPGIAKFGLKAVQSLGEATGKVVQFIPGVGKPVQEALHGVSMAAGAISDRIDAKLPGGWQKGMDVMNKANEIMDYIPKRRDFSEEEALQQRDISEAYYFEERDDDIALENREDSYFEERDDDDIALENREDSYFEADERDIYEPYDLD